MSRYVSLSVWVSDRFGVRWTPTEIAVDRIATMRDKPVMPGPNMNWESGGEIEVVGLGTLTVLETPTRIYAAIKEVKR